MKVKIVLLIVLFGMMSCGKECNHDAENQLENWNENAPSDYAYTVMKSAFLSPEYVGPYRFEVRQGAIDTIYFDLESYDDGPDDLFEGWDDFEQVKEFSEGLDLESLFETIINARPDHGCEIDYDPEYNYPSRFDLFSHPDIPDSGFVLRVSNFEILE